MTQQMAATGKSPKRNQAATMPSENATAKYPIAMGIPSRNPWMICCLLPAIQYPTAALSSFRFSMSKSTVIVFL